MLRLSIFAGLAGLHLAVLQFSYFFLLLINVTSTYVTYITVVVAWMVGTMVGLLWRRLTPVPALLAGVGAYYLTVALVLNAPLAGTTLPISALGVVATGLWAGRLFVDLMPRFNRVDLLFLHENNGFLVGIVGVFIGFTLLGQAFLFGAPLVSGLVQVGFLAWLHLRPPVPGHAAGSAISEHREPGDGEHRQGLLSQTLGDLVKRFAVLAVVLNVALPMGMILNSAMTGESYWKAFHGESNAITWFSSIQLVMVGLVAYAVFRTSGLLAGLSGEARSVGRLIWLVFALGFVFLALDERFELHEMLRDDALLPAGLFTGSSWMRAGDIGLFLYLGVGVIFGLVLLRELRRHMASLWLFLAAIGTSAVVVVLDALPEETVQSWPMPMFWNSVFEEVGELGGQLLFLLSFVVFLRAQIREAGRHLSSAARR